MTATDDWGTDLTEHAAAVYHLALVVLRDPDDARDVMQSVFELAWRHRARYDPQRPLRAWLLGIAGHEAVSAARRRRVRRWVTLAGDEPAAAAPQEVSMVLWEAIGSLPPAHRATVGLFYLHGYSIDEVSGLLGVPVGTVGSRLHTARRRLRALLVTHPDAEVRA